MTNKIKATLTAALAIAMIAGVQVTAFAATSASAPDASSSAVDEIVVVSQQDDTSASSAADDKETTSQSSTAGAINQSPNTGIAVAPFTAALLAAAAVPVMLGTRKKK